MQAAYSIMNKALGGKKNTFSFNCKGLVGDTQKVACSLILLGNIHRTQCMALKVILALSSSCLFAVGGTFFCFCLYHMQNEERVSLSVTLIPPKIMKTFLRFLQNTLWIERGLHWASIGIKTLVACMALTSCLFGSSSLSFASLLLLLVWAVFHIIFNFSVNSLNEDQRQLFSCLLLILTSLLTIWFLGFFTVPLLPN